MLHSPRVTRSRAVALAVTEAEVETSPTMTAVQEAETEATVLQAAMRELRQLRAERERERVELADLRRRMEERGRGEPEERLNQGQYRPLNLKSDTFDGSESLSEYVAQFELVARANSWSEREKTLAFAASLRGKARSVLDGMGENLSFVELKSKLELRFGERVNFQGNYSAFTNRRMKFGEDYASFGGELEKLARYVYPECTFEVRDKIVCAQFVAGLPEGFVKRTLQLEGVISLRTAVERAKVVREISERGIRTFERNYVEGARFEIQNVKGVEEKGNFSQNKGKRFLRENWKNSHSAGENFSGKRENLHDKQGGKKIGNFNNNNKECWQCGLTGHFRAECPTLINKGLLN